MVGLPRVVVVEDDGALRDAIAGALRHEGYVVRSTGLSQRVRSLVRRFRPDIAVLDVRLPEGPDGFELARSIRGESDVSVVFVTARFRATEPSVTRTAGILGLALAAALALFACSDGATGEPVSVTVTGGDLVLERPDAEPELLYRPADAGLELVDASLRPGSTPHDVAAALLVRHEDEHILRYVTWTESGPVEAGSFPDEHQIGGRIVSPDRAPVWSSEGRMLAWTEMSDDSSTPVLRTVAWDVDARYPGAGGAGFLLESVPGPVEVDSWADRGDGMRVLRLRAADSSASYEARLEQADHGLLTLVSVEDG